MDPNIFNINKPQTLFLKVVVFAGEQKKYVSNQTLNIK
jgi:hypothetical protein